MTTDLYQDFSERYDLFLTDEEKREPGFADFFRSVFVSNGVKRVLDCACGTGRELMLFHEMGFEVIGADLSASMLEQARSALRARGMELRLERADYRELPQHFGAQFDAIVCLRSSIAHMPTDAEAFRAFRSMLGALRKRGLLVLSQGTTDGQWRQKPRFIPIVNTEQVSRVISIDYVGKRDAVYNILDLFHSAYRTDFKVWSARYHFLFRDEQEGVLEEAGFKRAEFYGGYRFEPYDKQTSRQLITVAYR